MSVIDTALLAAPAPGAGAVPGFPTSLVVIVVIVAVLGVIAAIGWRSPDRPPHADEAARREEEE
jgi:hypothetical protein